MNRTLTMLAAPGLLFALAFWVLPVLGLPSLIPSSGFVIIPAMIAVHLTGLILLVAVVRFVWNSLEDN